MAEKNDDWKLTRHDALFGDATENATRESRGYVPIIQTLSPEEATFLRPGYTPPQQTLEAGEGLAIEAMALAEEVKQRKEGETTGAAPTCGLCGSTLKTQEGLSDKDLEDLAGLTRRASSLLGDPHPGIAMWCVATSDCLNSISLILRRSGI